MKVVHDELSQLWSLFVSCHSWAMGNFLLPTALLFSIHCSMKDVALGPLFGEPTGHRDSSCSRRVVVFLLAAASHHGRASRAQKQCVVPHDYSICILEIREVTLTLSYLACLNCADEPRGVLEWPLDKSVFYNLISQYADFLKSFQ